MRDVFCSYYTNSDDITSYMVRMLNITNNDLILEPSAGEGIFIDKIIHSDKDVQIDAFDINQAAIDILQKKYENISNIKIKKTDTLLDTELDFYSLTNGIYDKIIGNPPYGAWQDYDKRSMLKKKYPGQYVKESYSLFLLRCLSVLKSKGRLSFIIPDTYLFLNMHANLRKHLLTHTKIDEILIFPSKFFPGVSFGYSNLSIITLETCEQEKALTNHIRIIKGFKDSSEFSCLSYSNRGLPNHLEVYDIEQRHILQNDKYRFILAEQDSTDALCKSAIHLGDIANVVTGFYTGDNQKFIKVKNKDVRGAKDYDIVDSQKIYNCCSLNGIDNVSEGYIPYIKSSARQKYLANDDWFVRWDSKTIRFYLTNKKTRFQNSSFYFKSGIGIPMVKSNCLKAFLMKDKIFDQSIVGIFPKDETKLLYILALMNSDVVNKIIHLINPTANNSANYIKLIPYYEPDRNTLKEIVKSVETILIGLHNKDYDMVNSIQEKVNITINNLYKDNLSDFI